MMKIRYIETSEGPVPYFKDHTLGGLVFFLFFFPRIGILRIDGSIFVYGKEWNCISFILLPRVQ